MSGSAIVHVTTLIYGYYCIFVICEALYCGNRSFRFIKLLFLTLAQYVVVLLLCFIPLEVCKQHEEDIRILVSPILIYVAISLHSVGFFWRIRSSWSITFQELWPLCIFNSACFIINKETCPTISSLFNACLGFAIVVYGFLFYWASRWNAFEYDQKPLVLSYVCASMLGTIVFISPVHSLLIHSVLSTLGRLVPRCIAAALGIGAIWYLLYCSFLGLRHLWRRLVNRNSEKDGIYHHPIHFAPDCHFHLNHPELYDYQDMDSPNHLAQVQYQDQHHAPTHTPVQTEAQVYNQNQNQNQNQEDETIPLVKTNAQNNPIKDNVTSSVLDKKKNQLKDKDTMLAVFIEIREPTQTEKDPE